jgi:hypothetical protein
MVNTLIPANLLQSHHVNRSLDYADLFSVSLAIAAYFTQLCFAYPKTLSANFNPALDSSQVFCQPFNKFAGRA